MSPALPRFRPIVDHFGPRLLATVLGTVYRFAVRPRWLLGHLLVAALVVTMVGLGLWQLRRLDERRDLNRAVRARSAATVPLAEVASPTAAVLPEAVRFRRVSVTGRFDERGEALVRFRIRDGLPGYEALTPLLVGGRTAVLVNRGWLPLEVADGARAPVNLPTTEVTVEGLLLRGESSGRFRPEQRQDGRLVIGAISVADLEERLGYDLYPGFVQLEEPDDPQSFPSPLPKPDLGEGPHLTYAIQWFSFSAIAVVGWVLLVRKSARRRTRPPGPTPPSR